MQSGPHRGARDFINPPVHALVLLVILQELEQQVLLRKQGQQTTLNYKVKLSNVFKAGPLAPPILQVGQKMKLRLACGSPVMHNAFGVLFVPVKNNLACPMDIYDGPLCPGLCLKIQKSP